MNKLIIILTNLMLFCNLSMAMELVDKSYRESFLDDNLKKDYYKLQVNVANFFDKQTSSVNGLVESYRGTSIYSYDIFSKSFIIGKGGVLDAQSFTYDCAIASLAYLLAGQPKKTEKILKVYEKEFYASKGEFIGLCNAYRTDKPRRRWGLTIGIDGNRTHLGPNMWVTMAILQYCAVTGKLDMLPFAIDMLKWAQNLQHYRFSDGSKGGASMGYGWQPPDWSTVFSTENVIDHYAALQMLKDIYYNSGKDIETYFKKSKYSMKDLDQEIKNIEKWLVKVIYDKNKESFNMGYNAYGVDRVDALDTVSWMIMSLTPERLQKMNIDPFKLIDFATQNYEVTDTVENKEIVGYDFTSQKCRGKNYRMVWFEGTNFHIVALQMMAQYANKVGRKDLSKEYKDKAKSILSDVSLASRTINMPNGALPYTSKKPKDKQIFTTFAHEWEVPRGKDGQWVASSSSTGWYLIAASAFNPFQFDKENIDYKLFQ